ncbi:hypothetical protein BT69DRAFT_1350632 [Atractiella rhizophila]|nr:hypothetical protein BT69DRAFT_1350632 [Atractiella rhizophila]
MSTETQQPQGDVPQFTIIQRVSDIPLIHSSIIQTHSLLNSYPLSKKVYDTTCIYSQAAYERSLPVQKRLHGQIKAVDEYLNSGLDYVQRKYPYPFETPTEEVIARARQPADNAVHYTQARLNATLETIKPLQERLEALLAGPSNAAHQAGERILGISNALVGEVESVLQYAKEQGSALPSHVQTALSPLLSRLSAGYTDIKTELGKADVPLSTRAGNVLNYTRTQAGPVLQEAVEGLKELVRKGEKKGEEVKEKAEEAGEKGKQEVNEIQH